MQLARISRSNPTCGVPRKLIDPWSISQVLIMKYKVFSIEVRSNVWVDRVVEGRRVNHVHR
jgi:hypothetical protein